MSASARWLVISTNTGGDRSPYRGAHREYMRGLVERGVIFASGPIAEQSDPVWCGGATVLEVASAAEAHEIMRAEPYVNAGVRTYEIFAWNIQHGNHVLP